MKKTTLVVGDLHAPYMHRDAVAFLKAVKAKYKPNEVVFMGDEVDSHAISYHEHDPDLPGPKDELSKARKQLAPIYKLFSEATILESNHGSLVYRKAATAGLPSEVIKSYREILQAPKRWKWVYDYIIKSPLGDIYCHHGKSGSYEKLSKNMAMSAIQGHFHNKFYVVYWSSPNALYFDANAGCLVDNHSRAMSYGKNNLQKPILGVIVIVDGIPQPVPMVMGKDHRWNGRL